LSSSSFRICLALSCCCRCLRCLRSLRPTSADVVSFDPAHVRGAVWRIVVMSLRRAKRMPGRERRKQARICRSSRYKVRWLEVGLQRLAPECGAASLSFLRVRCPSWIDRDLQFMTEGTRGQTGGRRVDERCPPASCGSFFCGGMSRTGFGLRLTHKTRGIRPVYIKRSQ
jgi:hypothetical protein